ncbi:unnamed protein product [Polarella glacialis]|uniref:Uncharacterized protein n=1 Tax=Polarella glacialis TaxID=89957 RepID=A0A813GBG4_POLGL|nr:unnamed protein product [Polarella glacialis]CAE8621543.1 unnamed protein product [Polarella glacialis]
MELGNPDQSHAGSSTAFTASGDIVAPPAFDKYFSDEIGLIATFDFDYDNMISFETKKAWLTVGLCPLLYAPCCTPCFLQANVEGNQRNQHVCLTHDGIKKVNEKHRTLCGWSCTDEKKMTKMVHYFQITDCDVQEPSGVTCGCIDNVLSRVIVDTAASSQSKNTDYHALDLKGLKYAFEFKLAVWAMKRGRVPQSQLAAPVQAEMNTQLQT